MKTLCICIGISAFVVLSFLSYLYIYSLGVIGNVGPKVRENNNWNFMKANWPREWFLYSI